MALSCLLRHSIKQIKVNPLKNVALQNLAFQSQLRWSACVSHLATAHKQPTKLSQWDAVKPFSTSAVSMSAHGDHSKIWTAERALSGAMLVILPAAFLMPSQVLDTLMAIAVVMHMHWGIEAIVIDYVRPVIFGPLIPKIGVGLVFALSIATLAGLLNFIFNDVGLANGVRLLWKL